MASDTFRGPEKRRFPTLLLLGILMATAVVVVAFAVDSEYGWPVLILLAICAAAAIGYRLLAGSNRREGDSSDPVLKQPANPSRPLGDTPEAHDEINPHDVPTDSPVRPAVEEEAGGPDGTTRGPVG
jgi:hypothetical protein